MDCGSPSAWEELVRTASAVRAAPGFNPTAQLRGMRLRRAIRPVATGAVLLSAFGFAVLHLAATARIVSANSGQDSALFSLTNQDRTSNGRHSLVFSGTLENIGEGAPYDCKGVHVNGRSDDMIRRNYFAHPILGCGEYVFSMMQAYGVHYSSAGENIGWESGAGDPASYINSAFMASPDHKANILDPSYTEMGIGSDESAPGVTWTGEGSQQNVWMFSEEFAQVGTAPPPPRKTPPPRPAPRNSPAPAPPAVPPATTAPLPSTPAPTATPLVIPAGSLPQDLPAPPIDQYEGLYPNTVESILEAFLNF